MIFSAIEFAPQGSQDKRRAVSLRAEPYAQHQLLWSFFDLPEASPRPFLFRFRDAEEGVRFWMLSDSEPTPPDPAWRIRSKPFEPTFATGDEMSFELRVNATTSVRRPGQRGLRVDVIADGLKATQCADRPAERARLVHRGLPDWLAKRAQALGFELVPRPAVGEASAEIDSSPPCVVRRYEVWRLDKSRHSENRVTLGVSDLAGRLRVIDASRFQTAVATGVGHGKGFGLGMFLLKRVRPTDPD